MVIQYANSDVTDAILNTEHSLSFRFSPFELEMLAIKELIESTGRLCIQHNAEIIYKMQFE